MLTFSIAHWQGWTPGFQDPSSWQHWAEHPYCPLGDQAAARLDFLPPMQRRRLSPLARGVFACAWPLADGYPDMPFVFASRHGETTRNFGLLESLAADEPLSPTAFGLSVHNGVGAQHSILRGMRSNAVCVASSWATPEAGVVEALGLLHEGAGEVLLVCYDAPLPGAYAGFHDEAMVDFAWAALLTLPQAGAPRFALQAGADLEGQKGLCSMPHALNVLHFLLQPRCASLVRSQGASAWRWERLHA